MAELIELLETQRAASHSGREELSLCQTQPEYIPRPRHRTTRSFYRCPRSCRCTNRLEALILSTAVPTIIEFSLWREYFPQVVTVLAEMQEVYNSDTVELINWIKRQVPVAAVFAGSPQLISLVKLCSGLTVANLPLYNDIDLLKRNENIYQIYAMRSAEDVYKILTSYKVDYVIIEEAVCSEMGTARGCRVKDLLDFANGHVVFDEGESHSFSRYGRFCHEIKSNYSPYVNYFTRVFWNFSYHVYKVSSIISFQY
ncbi:LOW QUALITY PROTEIN: probable C-mannosyltransferase DPY19L4 [Polypterus senegalus]|uniref:LOW QUALITY PROTEIN: probable C-mannosyltransferase DPY19L4 n=1 Tax=Polypterus senegalus TaxID=55291 RepID=UPI001963F867|nr:LOW QUALITY PROTEIN: probable C-mannosyltransferase DPY19L4 [Polypterus senegalus]